jgi:HEAT repeat protein
MLQKLAINNADNQVAIARAGAIAPLVNLLSDPLHAVRAEAAIALEYLVVFEAETNYGNQVAIGQTGAILTLAKLLKDPYSSVRVAAAGALRSLAYQNADNQARITQVGFLPAALVPLLHRDNVTVPPIVLIRTLAGSSTEGQAAIAKAGAIEPLAQLLKHEDSIIRGEAAEAIISLARNNADNQAAMSQAGVSSELLKGDPLASSS